MSVIAFDGTVIAADKQGTRGGNSYTATKLHRIDKDTVAGYVGSLDHGAQLFSWYCAGADDARFPCVAQEDDRALLVVLHKGVLGICHGAAPVIHVVEDVPFAVGSGEDVALGAMMAGASAVRAVELACEMNIYCGKGVDAFDAVVKKTKRAKR